MDKPTRIKKLTEVINYNPEVAAGINPMLLFSSADRAAIKRVIIDFDLEGGSKCHFDFRDKIAALDELRILLEER